MPYRGHVCSHDHMPLCHRPHGLTKYNEACQDYSKPEALNVYAYIFSICFILGALYKMLGSTVSTGTNQTGLLVSRSWQSSRPCSGFQRNCKEGELPLNFLLLRKALKRYSIFTSLNEKVKSLLTETLQLVMGRNLQLVEGKSSQPGDSVTITKTFITVLIQEGFTGFWKKSWANDF